MSHDGVARPRGNRWRGVQAALVGIAAGMVGVAASRLFIGPAAAPVGILIGAAALVVGTTVSWRLQRLRRPADSPSVPQGLRLRRRVHPLAWPAPVAGSAITMVAWAGVARSSGSGWVQAVGALIGAFLVVGLIAPVLPAARARVTCTASPGDGQVGRPLELTFEVDRPVRLRPRWPAGTDRQAGGTQRGARAVTLPCTPGRRGIVDAVVVEVASSAPFGLLWWARDVELPLARLLHVAPRSGEADDTLATIEDAAGDAPMRVPSGVGEPRGVRPYAAGDPRRAVHWPATSHVGTLMVRESERQTDDPVTVEVVLAADPVEAERTAERMMATVGACIDRRQPVVLITHEETGRVVGTVTGRTDLGRRLARAVPG